MGGVVTCKRFVKELFIEFWRYIEACGRVDSAMDLRFIFLTIPTDTHV